MKKRSSIAVLPFITASVFAQSVKNPVIGISSLRGEGTYTSTTLTCVESEIRPRRVPVVFLLLSILHLWAVCWIVVQ